MDTALIDHLADLSSLRDRDDLDVTLAEAVGAILRPRSVVIARAVGSPEGRHWLTRAQVRHGQSAGVLAPAWWRTDGLPTLEQYPLRCAALSGKTICGDEGGAKVSVFPLATERETDGVIEIVTEQPLDDAERRLMSSLLRVFGNFQNLLDYSERDTLTGLLNRKTFDDNFFRAILSAKAADPDAEDRRRAPNAATHWWLAMVDIDFFKSVNDTYGHLIGDEVLLLLARLMRDTLRFQDRLFRFGGEEFVIVMPCDVGADAGRALERLRRRTETHTFPQVGSLTVSIGFTMILPGDSPSTALERADRAVYHAKESGRNQVCSHADLVARGQAAVEEVAGEIELF